MSPRVEIDPDGDVLLCLFQTQSLEGTTDENTGGKKKRIRELVVSSKVLSLASPVFKAMFCGNFKESIELAVKKTSLEPTSLEPYGISLPEDDADATTILCRVLHYKIDEIPEKPTTICLEKLAFLSDKYQCVNALMYSGSLWLRNWLRVHETKKMSMDDLCRLLIFAYVIDLPYEFVCISWEIFLAHKGSLLGPSTQVVVLLDHPLLHEDIARKTPISLISTKKQLTSHRRDK
ncbi:hypothetical protein V493_07453 [Pseudogymnoascus sp. VKM F-4281 (FW-2241)]|nr:hypothetical protein V493_07453 [Pseudogymnoascus sp. VKM F-4281 (FW-2241)]